MYLLCLWSVLVLHGICVVWVGKGYLLCGQLKLKFHYAHFHRNFLAGKVVDTNHESRGHKR